jgi:hypothetical protein
MFGGAFAGLLCEPFGLIVAIKFLVEIFSDYRSNNSFNLGFWNRHEILQSWDGTVCQFCHLLQKQSSH